MRFKSFKEYILFLYVHIAYADGEVHPLERKLILEKMKLLYPGERDLETPLDKMLTTYLEMAGSSDEIIKGAHEQFHNVEFYKKYKVFIDLYQIIHADGIVSESEKEALEKLRVIIGIEIDHS